MQNLSTLQSIPIAPQKQKSTCHFKIIIQYLLALITLGLLSACGSVNVLDASGMVGQPINVAYNKWGPPTSIEKGSNAQGPYRAYIWTGQKTTYRGESVHGVTYDPQTNTQTTHVGSDYQRDWCKAVLFTDLNNIIFESQMDDSSKHRANNNLVSAIILLPISLAVKNRANCPN